INDDGTVTYTPNADFNGTDTFTYTNVDGNTETVTVTVDPIADDTVLVADSATTNEDTPITIDVVGNDTDVDNGEVSPVDTVTQGSNGSVAINDDGTVTYTPNADFNGTDTFTYTNEDGNTETVSVTVDPVADDSILVADSATTNEDTPITIDVVGNDTDVDNGEVSPVDTVTQGANGTVAINDDGTVTYTPNADFNGKDTFTYTNVDGNTETVTVTVDPVEDPTEIIVGSSDSELGEVTEDFDVTTDSKLTDSGTLTFIDVDIEDSENFEPTVEFTPSEQGDTALGNMTINADGDWSYEVDNSAVQYLGEDETLTEVYTVTLNGVTQDITVTINGVDDLSVVAGDATGSVTEDADAATLTTSGNLSLTDVDTNDTTTFTPATVTGAYGAVTIDENGDWSYAADNTQAAIQALDDGEFLTDTITVTTSDGVEQEIVITINGVDD
ncbi:Ig-like domain-containing protein, partial [Psychromonas arctica]